MKKLNTEKLEYEGIETLSYINIVEVAIRHGFDPDLKQEFLDWVEDKVEDHVDYRRWEDYMGEDL